MKPFRIFVGFDQVESVAYHVLCQSILSRSSVPITFCPINLSNLGEIYQRPRDPKQSNEFSFSRFLVPYLCDYDGWALFMDLDMLMRCDIKKLIDQCDDRFAVKVVKHDYMPSEETKYLGATQYQYPRKNWSSFILWNCSHPSNRTVRPHYVNTAPALDLHRFNWLKDDEIGELPVGWNWLVGEYSLNGFDKKEVKNVHFTVGGPYFREYNHVDFAEEWFDMKAQMANCKQRGE